MLVAKDKGFFKKHNLNVTFKTFSGGGSVVGAALASGSIQGAHGSLEFLESNAKGVTHVVGVYELSESAYQIYTEPDITSPNQLIGKKIGTSSLSGAEYIWWNSALPTLGVPISSIHFVTISGGPAKFAALQKDAVQAVVDTIGHEPKGAPKALVSYKDMPQQPHLVGFQQSFIDAHPAAVQGFVDAMDEAVAWTKANLPEATKICETEENATADECDLSTDATNPPSSYTWSKTGAINVKSIEDDKSELEALYPDVTDAIVKAFPDTSYTGISPQ